MIIRNPGEFLPPEFEFTKLSGKPYLWGEYEQPVLQDSFGRIHDYLRISLTDRCNFRCLYCLPEPEAGNHCGTQDQMTGEEIFRLAGIFTGLGVRKIRLTGGEPLVRKDAGEIMTSLGCLPVKLVLTTNGARVHHFMDALRRSGIRSVNVSLDTLRRDRFRALTHRDEFDQVFRNIRMLIEQDFHVKVNVVVMNGYNEDELCDFVAWTRDTPLHIRFIEFMPFPGNRWRPEKLMNFGEILQIVADRFPAIEKLEDHPHDTTKKFRVENHAGTFAVISTMSEPFCSGCNRLRLTADGKMRNCLFGKTETDLLTPLRQGADVTGLIQSSLAGKHWMLGGHTGAHWGIGHTQAKARSMMGIGG